MHKARVRSMQRAAQKSRGGTPLRMADVYVDHPPQMASADKPHLDFSKFGKTEDFWKIITVIKAAHKGGIGTASEVSKLLNKLHLKTAIGETWTPRLAWFAGSAMRAQTQRSVEHSAHKPNDSKAAGDPTFNDQVARIVTSRLCEIQTAYEASKATLGDVGSDLMALKHRLEGKKP